MESSEQAYFKIKVNYYTGRLLAQSGILYLREHDLLFRPKSTIDRAMGAKDVSIPLEKITWTEMKGTLIKTLYVHTDNTEHRIVGSGIDHLKQRLDEVLKNARMNSVPASPARHNAVPLPSKNETLSPVDAKDLCPSCNSPIEEIFKYCPFCQTPLKRLCPKCNEIVRNRWKACAQCGSLLNHDA